MEYEIDRVVKKCEETMAKLKETEDHLKDAESDLQNLKGCPKFYGQSEETWIPQIKRCEGRIYTLKQAIKLIKANKGE